MIGLIFGETEFPKEILKKIKKKGIKHLIIDLSTNKEFKKEKNSHVVSIGKFGQIIKILKENKCKKVIFAGKVKKPHFSNLKLDLKGVYYFPRILKSSKLGDAAILKEIIKILKYEKINTINPLTFNPELTLSKGIYSKLKPSIYDKKDIAKAIQTLNKINEYNFTQGIVVRNKKVIALETKTGTEQMLKKCKNFLFKNNGVLVKFPKKKQDLRIDLPTVGLKTFSQCKDAGLKGLVLKSKKNIFLEKKKSINFADKNKMFIIVK